MEDKIERHLTCSMGPRIKDLRVEVSGDQIVLQGRTNTYYGRQLAQHGVLDLIPSARVVNAIEVC